jgi:hypothetical protein
LQTAGAETGIFLFSTRAIYCRHEAAKRRCFVFFLLSLRSSLFFYIPKHTSLLLGIFVKGVEYTCPCTYYLSCHTKDAHSDGLFLCSFTLCLLFLPCRGMSAVSLILLFADVIKTGWQGVPAYWLIGFWWFFKFLLGGLCRLRCILDERSWTLGVAGLEIGHFLSQADW